MSANLPELYNVYLSDYHHLHPVNKIKKKSIQTQASKKNAKLVNILTNKMFKGYTKIKELHKDQGKQFFQFNKYLANSPVLQWEQYVPLPFEDTYNYTYKDRFLSKLNGPNLGKLVDVKKVDIKNKEKQKNHQPQKSQDQLYITTNSNKTSYVNQNTQTEGDLLGKIFSHGKSEMEKFSSLHFFAIDKNPLDIDYPVVNLDKKERNPYVEAEFLYKISHTHKPEKNSAYNFYTNKGIKRGFAKSNLLGEKKKQNEKIELNLNIVPEKLKSSPKFLTSKEKKEKFIENQLNMIKSVPNDLFKNFEDNLFDDNDEEKEEKIEPNVNKTTYNMSEHFLNSTSNMTSHREIYDMNSNLTTYKPQINKAKYVSGQMSFRNSRFNFIRDLAFTQKEYSSVQASPKRVLKHFINPKSHLFTQPKHTNKSSYDKQSKQRDIIISSKLKGYYSQNDIERLLNGRQPLQTE